MHRGPLTVASVRANDGEPLPPVRPYLSCCLLPAEGHLSKAIGQELDHTVILCKQHPLSVTARPNKDWFLSQKRLHASLKNDTVYEQRDRIVFRRNFTSRRSLFQGFPNDSLGPFLWPTLRSCVCVCLCTSRHHGAAVKMVQIALVLLRNTNNGFGQRRLANRGR